MSHHLESIDAVLTFWFGNGQTATQIAAEKTALWWSKDPNTDRQIADRFGYDPTALALNGPANPANLNPATPTKSPLWRGFTRRRSSEGCSKIGDSDSASNYI